MIIAVVKLIRDSGHKPASEHPLGVKPSCVRVFVYYVQSSNESSHIHTRQCLEDRDQSGFILSLYIACISNAIYF